MSARPRWARGACGARGGALPVAQDGASSRAMGARLLAAIWLAFLVWLAPFGATEPSLSAMAGTGGAVVTESSRQIVIEPSGQADTGLGVLFQPGARVDARAYVDQFLPVAEAGYPVVIIKQPLGIAFTALPRWPDPLREPYVARWVVAGHSLGGTVAAIQADDHDGDEARRVGRTHPARLLPCQRHLVIAHGAYPVHLRLRGWSVDAGKDRRVPRESAAGHHVHRHRGRKPLLLRRLRGPAGRRRPHAARR
nr:alpha/beta hydrolase [Demequina litorisediminis]